MKLHILCVNDLHAEIFQTESTPGCAKLAAAIEQYTAQNPNTIVLFGGDNYKGDPISEYTSGKPINALMKKLDVVASVMGNHEYDFEIDDLARWQNEGNYTMLAANLFNQKEKMPEFVKPYIMVEQNGIKIAIIGLSTVEELNTAMHPACIRELHLSDGVDVAQRWVNWLSSGNDPHGVPDAIIALTHFGSKYDPNGNPIGEEIWDLCNKVTGIDAAFTAHWHQSMALHMNGIPVAQGGSRGQGFALMTLTFDENKQLISVDPSYVNLVDMIDTLPSDHEIETVIEECNKTGMAYLGEILGNAEENIPHRTPSTNEPLDQGSALTELALHAMMEHSNRRIALFYSGWWGDGLKKGPITRYEIAQMFRFNGGMVGMKVSGEILLSNLSIGIRNLRGESLSPLAVAGLNITADLSKAFGNRLVAATLANGMPIEKDKEYEIVVDGSIAESTMGFDFSKATDRVYFEESIRECICKKICKDGTVDPTQPTNFCLLKKEEIL